MRSAKSLHISCKGVSYDLKLEWLDESHTMLMGTVTDPGSESQELEQFEAKVSRSGRQIHINSERGTQLGYAVKTRNGLWISLGDKTAFFETAKRDVAATGDSASETEIHAPMTGKIVSVNVKPEQKVKAGDILVILEAMKMEFKLEAPINSVVESVNCEVGQLVDLGQLLVQLEPAEGD